MSLLLAGSAGAQVVVLSAEHIAVAGLVHVGTLPCELGQTVVLLAEPGRVGYFSLRIGKASYRLSPELTTTGAVRLEDKGAGVVWLQLANKSMLMNQKQGKRMADECKSTAQLQIADEMRKNPPASVLEDNKPAVAVVVTPAVVVVVTPAVVEVVTPAVVEVITPAVVEVIKPAVAVVVTPAVVEVVKE